MFLRLAVVVNDADLWGYAARRTRACDAYRRAILDWLDRTG